jgi:hypothetical protein
MNLPFTETKDGQYFIREFSQDTPQEELVWHRDREDRIVESMHPTDWLVQLDNQLPLSMNTPIFIPKETFHRVIKGSGNLTIKLLKLTD